MKNHMHNLVTFQSQSTALVDLVKHGFNLFLFFKETYSMASIDESHEIIETYWKNNEKCKDLFIAFLENMLDCTLIIHLV